MAQRNSYSNGIIFLLVLSGASLYTLNPLGWPREIVSGVLNFFLVDLWPYIHSEYGVLVLAFASLAALIFIFAREWKEGRKLAEATDAEVRQP